MNTSVALPELPLFAYGSLTDETFTGRLLEREIRGEPAQLLDFELLTVGKLAYPTVFAAVGERVEGRLYRGLGAADYERLDWYEGVNEGLYQRVEARVAVPGGAPEPCSVYVATEKTLRRHRVLP